ncbi:protein-glutamate methylesterase/protein-glutamine glutaminase [Paenibacillus pinistramenti]|uniref:protein-glutamate methylesterase/protein-glutamine glutaminase n=1 Tax=Paenibacillus pinistramenti TaxID=1768003 RepID=UPI00110985D3|nr:chemotaxis response regulator protein-glutamate methylesterase [Paenibacillus pinistramenti]
MIRVLVVDDSAFMRKMIAEIIEEAPGFTVVGRARNGEEAVRLAEQLKPDVMTLDVEMPVMNGLEALKVLMKQPRPVPVVMISSLTQDGAETTIEALQLGAVDFVAKPSGSISRDLYKVKAMILDKVATAASVRRPFLPSGPPAAAPGKGGLAGKAPARPGSAPAFGAPAMGAPASGAPAPGAGAIGAAASGKPAGAAHSPAGPAGGTVPSPAGTAVAGITAIGTSTGGPKALLTLLSAFPADYKYPIVIVQHMPPKFTASLAQRLNQLSPLTVMEAAQHQRLLPGHVYLAPGGYHMEVEPSGGEYRIVLSQQAPVNGHRPSVDVLFDSVSRLPRLKRSYVILTGMGNDGARAMQRAKQAFPEAFTIAEAEQTCVVYGMPRAAVELGCVDCVAPLEAIVQRLVASQ